jgi:hypothetical protein
MSAVKGTAWLTFQEFLESKFGKDAHARVLAGLGREDAKSLSQKILPIAWVEYGAYTRYLLKADQVLGRGDHALIREGAVYHAQKDMKGLYRMFLRIATPGFVLARSAQLWGLMMDSGVLTVDTQTPASVELKLTDFKDMPRHHELDQLPFMEEIARMTGVVNVRSGHPKCLARGDDHCRYVIAWS